MTATKPCDYCGSPTPGHIEHSEPQQRGGSSLAVNLAHACSYCNLEKSDRTLDEWAGDRTRVGLSWPPMSSAAFRDGLADAVRRIDPIVASTITDRLPELEHTVLDFYRAARRSTAFTFDQAASDLADAARRLPVAA